MEIKVSRQQQPRLHTIQLSMNRCRVFAFIFFRVLFALHSIQCWDGKFCAEFCCRHIVIIINIIRHYSVPLNQTKDARWYKMNPNPFQRISFQMIIQEKEEKENNGNQETWQLAPFTWIHWFAILKLVYFTTNNAVVLLKMSYSNGVQKFRFNGYCEIDRHRMLNLNDKWMLMRSLSKWAIIISWNLDLLSWF